MLVWSKTAMCPFDIECLLQAHFKCLSLLHHTIFRNPYSPYLSCLIRKWYTKPFTCGTYLKSSILILLSAQINLQHSSIFLHMPRALPVVDGGVDYMLINAVWSKCLADALTKYLCVKLRQQHSEKNVR